MNRCFMFSEVMHVVKFISANLTSFSCMSLFDMISQSGPTCKFSLTSVTLKLCTITMLQNNVFSQPFHKWISFITMRAIWFQILFYNVFWFWLDDWRMSKLNLNKKRALSYGTIIYIWSYELFNVLKTL